jgi:hypothetical protein
VPVTPRILDRQRRYDDADETFRLAFEYAPAPSNVIIGQMHRDYGLMVLQRGDHGRAKRELLQSLSLLQQAYTASDHPNLQETKRGLMALYGLMAGGTLSNVIVCRRAASSRDDARCVCG